MKKIIGTITIVILVSACTKTTEKTDFSIKGSDSELELTTTLANRFEEEYPQIKLAVSGGGSAFGLQ